MLTLDLSTARRFILGKQGLWPGRRFRSLKGTEAAIRAMTYLQLDPLQIIARSQDIALHSRVLEYKPEMWEDVTYKQRKFFDWGGWLALRPMDDLPHWRVVMQREHDGDPDCDPRTKKNGQKHAGVIEEMRAFLREQETASNRDFSMAERTRMDGYRGRKDSSVALYHLWRTGEVMTHHRDNFERVYALSENVAPAELLQASSREESDRFLFRNEVAFLGLSRFQRTADAFFRGVPFSKKDEIIASLLADEEIVEVKVEGWKFAHYALAADVPLIEELAAGRIPRAWKPLETDTTEEAVFLAPLDPASTRGRAKQLFGFDYVWEVYKKAEDRKYGYYTLPVLWGDQLVARFDSKLDRDTNTFVLLGFWLEDEALGKDEAFAEALARGFVRFKRFLRADKLDVRKIEAAGIRARVENEETKIER
jgi:uncharacterized protein YcaQ